MTPPDYSIAILGSGYAIYRDKMPLKTPAGADLIVPSTPLAEAVATEWRAQTKKIDFAEMPLTQLACTAIDISTKNHGKIIDQLLSYIGSELLCHRAEDPPELARQQHEIWQPVLDWCAQRFNAQLHNGIGVMPIVQPQEAARNLRHALEVYDPFHLTGIKQAADVSNSLVLGLALAERHLTARDVFHAAELDSTFQMQKWGEDPASARRRENIKRDLALCERWFELLRPVR